MSEQKSGPSKSATDLIKFGFLGFPPENTNFQK